MADFDRNGRRGKPGRELYRPGSGPLRKSGRGDEEGEPRARPPVSRMISARNQEIQKISEELKKITMCESGLKGGGEGGGGGDGGPHPDPPRKARKPDTVIYVPKRVAENREQEKLATERRDERRYEERREEKARRREEGKKRKGKGKGGGGGGGGPPKDETDPQTHFHNAPHHPPSSDIKSRLDMDNRFVRHGSEPPRSGGGGMERGGDCGGGGRRGGDGGNRKPPSGRRGSSCAKLPPSFDSLPPRLQKKYIVENGLQSGWDGSSLTFQGHYNKPPLSHRQEEGEWCQTIPRSRAPVHQETRYSRSMTPEKKSEERRSVQSRLEQAAERSTEEKENWRGLDNTTTGGGSVGSNEPEAKRPTPPPPTPTPPPLSPQPAETQQTDTYSNTHILDWAAEVERCELLENMGMSRTESHESFVEPQPPPPKDKRKKKRRSGGKNESDRSLSRERGNNNYNVNNNSRVQEQNNNGRWRRRNSGGSRHSSPDRHSHRERRTSSRERRPVERERRTSERERRTSERERRTSERERRTSERERRTSERERKPSERERRTSEREREELTNWRLEKRLEGGGSGGGILVVGGGGAAPPQRTLYDPNNPAKPIQVPSSRPQHNSYQLYPASEKSSLLPAPPSSDHQPRPLWYNPYTESFQSSHNPQLLRDMEQCDRELQCILSTGGIVQYWDHIQQLRQFLKDALKRLLLTDLRFCQAENVEQHLWKILYYNIIELLRKFMIEHLESKDKYKHVLLTIIEEGTVYFEGLLEDLEKANKIQFEDFLSSPMCLREGLGYTGLALVAAQKLFLFLGDLARYKDQANESPSNYGVARQWYMKAHQINPKNGRPYNQLAILAMYTKRKLDAVYYYMRSLMASNPLITARDSLLSLFDENRKKYEGVERRRKEERAAREKEKMKEKEGGGGLRREIWVHPGGGKNVHRTTSASAHTNYDSEDAQLYTASNMEVNKRFCMSYLHVHGKFFTKIGLESLTETAVQMLKEFRALLQHSPIPLNSIRFLQLLALNMFAIEITQPKDINQMEPGYRPALQESALVVSLQMFNLMVERFVQLLKEHVASPEPPSPYIVPSDCLALLPAIKVWCDWLMTHVEVWNPPPSCQDYKVGPAGDCWSRLATLVSLLERLDYKRNLLSTQQHPGYELVYLPEDATLCGFTPLMANAQDPIYTSNDTDMELAQVSLRVHKVLFFGSVFLCGLDPPVLKVHKLDTGLSEYVSIVDTPSSQEQSDADVCIESESSTEGESDDSGKATGLEEEEAGGEYRSFLIKKKELERISRKHLRRNKHYQKILDQSVVVEMEVRPAYLVPDTNCFIGYLSQLEAISRWQEEGSSKHPYTLMVPLVVVNELEGLSQGCKPSLSLTHAALVREGAREAISFLHTKHPALRCVTTRGTVLNSTTLFEEDMDQEMKNDDRILTTCINLCQSYSKDDAKKDNKEGKGSLRKIFRNVVLLTEDRNLRVKALSNNVPVRELPDFMRWAAIG